MTTINMNMKFEIEIPKQTWLMLRKPCRLQTDGRTDGQGESSIPPPPPTLLGGGIIIGHLFYTTSSFVHHFKSISEFKLELQSGNAQFGSKSTFFFLICVTLQFDVRPWKIIWHLFYATSSFVHHFVAIGEFKLELQSGNAQFGSNSTIFRAVWPWNLTDDLEKQ